jgi:hypothetical protein
MLAQWPMPTAFDLPYTPGPGGGSQPLQLTLYKRLGSGGVVRYERRRILAVIGVDRWPAQDSRHKVQVRGRVIQALVEQTTPDPRSAALIALLHTIEHEIEIVDPGHLAEFRSRFAVDFEFFDVRKHLLERGEEIANSNWAPEVIRSSIDAIIAATRKAALSTRRSGGGNGG